MLFCFELAGVRADESGTESGATNFDSSDVYHFSLNDNNAFLDDDNNFK